MDYHHTQYPYQSQLLSNSNSTSSLLNSIIDFLNQQFKNKMPNQKLFKFSAIIVLAFPICCLCFFLLPFLLFISFPLLFSYLFFKVVAIQMEFVRSLMFGNSVDKKVKIMKNITEEEGIISRMNRQESIDLDAWEFPSSCATEEDGDAQELHDEFVEQQEEEESNWHIVFSKSSTTKEPKGFNQVLSYWKKKERGDHM